MHLQGGRQGSDFAKPSVGSGAWLSRELRIGSGRNGAPSFIPLARGGRLIIQRQSDSGVCCKRRRWGTGTSSNEHAGHGRWVFCVDQYVAVYEGERPRDRYSKALSAQNSLQKNRLPASHALMPVAVNGSGSRQKAQWRTDLAGGLKPPSKAGELENGAENVGGSSRIAGPAEAMALSIRAARSRTLTRSRSAGSRGACRAADQTRPGGIVVRC
jgi:hypothetical protein